MSQRGSVRVTIGVDVSGASQSSDLVDDACNEVTFIWICVTFEVIPCAEISIFGASVPASLTLRVNTDHVRIMYTRSFWIPSVGPSTAMKKENNGTRRISP